VACQPHRQQVRRFFRQFHCTNLVTTGSVIAITDLL
jgi:hypothetical protein